MPLRQPDSDAPATPLAPSVAKRGLMTAVFALLDACLDSSEGVCVKNATDAFAAATRASVPGLQFIKDLDEAVRFL